MIKALEIKISNVFSLVFANNIILSCFLFSIIDLKFLITGVITQIFVIAAELAILTDTPIKKGKSEIEIHPVTTEAKIRKCSI